MDKKKILIVSRSFFPENSPRSFRTTELAKEFARQGHEVTVLTHRKEAVHAKFQKEYQVKIKDLGKPNWKPIEIKGKGLMYWLRRGVKRFSKLLIEYPNIELVGMVKRALKQESGYDLLISIAVPHPIHWGVAAARSKSHTIAKTWAADCGDPYMGAENDSFNPPFYFGWVEKWFCRKADFITIPVESAIEAYCSEFLNKLRVIPQGFRFDEVNVAPSERKSYPRFAFAGSLIPGRRDPKLFFNYLLNLEQDYQFDIYTKSVALVQPYSDKSDGRIRIKNYMPRLELLYELSKIDFVVNFENIGKKQIPSKLIDYTIINKPILSINSQSFNKDNVDAFLKRDYSNRLVISNPDQYRIENVTNNFLSLL